MFLTAISVGFTLRSYVGLLVQSFWAAADVAVSVARSPAGS